MQDPFNHVWGSDIYAKIIATNAYGDSEYSPLGNGAKITTYPDAPTPLIEDYSQRSATTLGLSWMNGASDGGAAPIDYTVSYDQGSDEYVVLESNILPTSYTATNLIPGTIYKFKV